MTPTLRPCIAGAIAQVHHGGIPDDIRDQALTHLDAPPVAVVAEFESTFMAGD